MNIIPFLGVKHIIKLASRSIYDASKFQFDLGSLRNYFNNFEGGDIKYERDESCGFAFIGINNPKKKNAISGSMMVDLLNIVEDLEKWENGKGIILYGIGDLFCSGADLDMIKKLFDKKEIEKLCYFMQCITNRFFQLPLVSIALIHGRALGGGAELTTMCDYRVFTYKGEVGFIHKNVGLSPFWGGGARLIQIVGYQKALELLLTSKIFNYKTAENINFSISTIDDESCFVKVKEILMNLTNAKCNLIHNIKKICINERKTLLQESLQTERSVFKSLCDTDKVFSGNED